MQAVGGSAPVSLIGGLPPSELLQTVDHPFGGPGKSEQEVYRKLVAFQHDIVQSSKQVGTQEGKAPWGWRT